MVKHNRWWNNNRDAEGSETHMKPDVVDVEVVRQEKKREKERKSGAHNDRNGGV